MDISQYPITTPFGWVYGYPLNQTDPVNHPGQGFHNGIDYGLPMNTPVIVNGVRIANSNNTGASTGPHLHVGKYQNGAAQNPGVGNGFSFNSAVVFDVGHDATNGNYVRLTADGALWNYLHLADGSINVSAGQVLDGGQQGVEPMFNEGDRVNINNYLYGQDRGRFHEAVGQEWKQAVYFGIFETVDFKTDELVNAGDVPAINAAVNRSDGSQTVGKPWKNFFYDYLVKLPHPAPGGGTYTDADRAQATETNNLVKQIWNKITGIFK